MRALIAADGRSYNYFCPLGVQNGRIADSQLTGSTEHPAPWQAKMGRLNGPNAWHPASGQYRAGEWFQVDLLTPTRVTGIVTQGLSDADQWTKSFYIYYGDHQGGLVPIQHDNESYMVFEGNDSRGTKKINLFPQPLTTRFVRVVVAEFYVVHVLRVELLGC